MDTALNNIVLNGAMLENLYGRSLVEIDVLPQPASLLKFQGSNLRNVTVLINNAEFVFLPEDQLSFLNKMLLACKMNTADVAILNMADGASMSEVMAQLKPEKIIAFGVSAEPGLSLLTLGKINDAVLLQAPDLGELLTESEEAKQLKGRLWSCLKELFLIA